jgi:hypothetical protein
MIPEITILQNHSTAIPLTDSSKLSIDVQVFNIIANIWQKRTGAGSK